MPPLGSRVCVRACACVRVRAAAGQELERVPSHQDPADPEAQPPTQAHQNLHVFYTRARARTHARTHPPDTLKLFGSCSSAFSSRTPNLHVESAPQKPPPCCRW